MLESINLINGRDRQEDRILVRVDDHITVLAVIDGMGGHPNGNLAAEDMVTWINDYFNDYSEWNENSLYDLNHYIVTMPKSWPDYRGAVMTLVIIHQGALYLLHKGDTRAYLLNGIYCVKITRDHVAPGGWLAQCFIRDDRNPCDEAITQADYLKQYDALLLTTDGLHADLSADQLHEYYQTSAEGAVLSNIAAAARAAGCTDNQSGILFHLH